MSSDTENFSKTIKSIKAKKELGKNTLNFYKTSKKKLEKAERTVSKSRKLLPDQIIKETPTKSKLRGSSNIKKEKLLKTGFDPKLWQQRENFLKTSNLKKILDKEIDAKQKIIDEHLKLNEKFKKQSNLIKNFINKEKKYSNLLSECVTFCKKVKADRKNLAF